MTKIVWAFFLACVFSQPVWSAELAATGRHMHKRVVVHVYPRRVELLYPRSLTVVSDGRLFTPRYACWAWAPGYRLRLVPLDWSEPCVSQQSWASGDVHFVENIRVH
jgi:hypothetical protein